MKKKSYPVTNIGSVSLIMVFIVLCLVTFATLSLSSAVRDHHFSEEIATHNSAYYEASNEATRMQAKIDGWLSDAYAGDPAGYPASAQELLTGRNDTGHDIAADFSRDAPTLTYQIPVDDRHALKVVLTLNQPETLSGGFSRVTTWQEISTAEWDGDDSLNVIQ